MAGNPMTEKVIGILGGMGPEATLDCFAKIIDNTPAQRDQDHLRVLIDNNPKAPDRTAAVLGTGESPVPALVQGCQALARAGADFVIIPCVSAHVFLDQVRVQSSLPVISIFDAVAEAIKGGHPGISTVGLLATTGTILGGLFQKRLAQDGISTLVPDHEGQERVMAAVYDIKNSRPARSRQAITEDLVRVAQGLMARGAQGIIAGCTEIPLVLRQELFAVAYFDSPLFLARAAIRLAGREPKPLS
jgi:aspartate racemase